MGRRAPQTGPRPCSRPCVSTLDTAPARTRVPARLGDARYGRGRTAKERGQHACHLQRRCRCFPLARPLASQAHPVPPPLLWILGLGPHLRRESPHQGAARMAAPSWTGGTCNDARKCYSDCVATAHVEHLQHAHSRTVIEGHVSCCLGQVDGQPRLREQWGIVESPIRASQATAEARTRVGCAAAWAATAPAAPRGGFPAARARLAQGKWRPEALRWKSNIPQARPAGAAGRVPLTVPKHRIG